MKAYKFKIKPSAKVESILISWLATCCELYNAALQERRDAYRINHISISYEDQTGQLPEIKQEREDFNLVHSQVLQNVLKRVKFAFDNFFRRVKEKKGKAGFPRFRSQSRYHRMPLHIRVYRCSRCHLVIDRDHNAALNIKEQKGRTVPSRRRRVAVVKESRTYRATDPESPPITR